MRRLVIFAAAHVLLLGAAWAQPAVNVRVNAAPCGKFLVDGQPYQRSAFFLWPLFSTHTFAPEPTYGISPDVICKVGDSFESDGAAQPVPGQPVSITDPATVTFTLHSAYWYRVNIFIASGPGQLPPPVNCNPGGQIRPTGAFVNGICYDRNSEVWLPAGTAITATMVAPPGWSDIGWERMPTAYPEAPLSFVLNGPKTLTATLQPSSHFTINTEPQGLKVLVDHTYVVAPVTFDWAPGSSHTLSPVTPQPYFVAPVAFDRAPGSKHTLSLVPPRPNAEGLGQWAFLSWSDNGPQDRIVEAPEARRSTALTLNYAEGVRVTFTTAPPYLRLVIDGRTDFSYYNFVWAMGSKHTISAPATQTDDSGRGWAFRQWSMGGAATQDYTVAPAPEHRGTATFDQLGQLLIRSSAPGATILVDNAPCPTPCAVNRAPGAQVKIAASPVIATGESEHMKFQGWSDGGPAERVWTAAKGTTTLIANYQTTYPVLAASDPAGGSDFSFSPASPDGFYPPFSNVTVTAHPKPGYKFRNWDGEIQLGPSLTIMTQSGPASVLANLDTYPYIGGVTNAAGTTPEPRVAPGSVVSIDGVDLAPALVNGPASPLARKLSGVTVQVDGAAVPLFFVSPNRINLELPSALAEGGHTLTVQQYGAPDVSATFTVARNAPGVFTTPVGDKAYALALHDDGTPVTPDNPAVHGETVTLLGTGFGPSQLAPPDGLVVSLDPKAPDYPLIDTVEIRVGDTLVLQPASSRAARGYTGRQAIRLLIADELPVGATVELRAAVKDPADPDGKTFHESNKVLLPIK